MAAANLVVDLNGVIDRRNDRRLVPVRQDMRGDEINVGRQLACVCEFLFGFRRIVVLANPDVPGFAGAYRDRAHALDALDNRDELVDGLVSAQDAFVADDDRIDVAVAPRQGDRRLDLALVAIPLDPALALAARLRRVRQRCALAVVDLVEPDADRDLETELVSNARDELEAASRCVGADRARVGAQQPQIGADLFRRRPVAVIRMLPSRVRENRKRWRAGR